MWPLTVLPPRFAETYVVSTVDKVLAVLEFGREAFGRPIEPEFS